jgi:hypothetical protein
MRGLKIDVWDLPSLPRAAIPHNRDETFVVLDRSRGSEIDLVDPASGRRTIYVDDPRRDHHRAPTARRRLNQGELAELTRRHGALPGPRVLDSHRSCSQGSGPARLASRALQGDAPGRVFLRTDHRGRWLRLYSLPESKRYAADDTEHAEVRRRAWAAASDVLPTSPPSEAPSRSGPCDLGSGRATYRHRPDRALVKASPSR